jgi:hypothetical protein
MTGMSTGFDIGEEAAPSRAAGSWKSSGLRMHPAVRRALRASAALEGTTMPELLHRILVERLQADGYLMPLSGQERPE